MCLYFFDVSGFCYPSADLFADVGNLSWLMIEGFIS